ncbi:MAG: ABC transporter substrate-binding protein [Lautropia sp.]
MTRRIIDAAAGSGPRCGQGEVPAARGPRSDDGPGGRRAALARLRDCAVLAGSAYAASGNALAQAPATERIGIAFIDLLSGPYAPVGQGALAHFRYLADVANDRRWAGRERSFEILTFDGEGDPARSLERLDEAIGKGARYVAQGSGSAVANALAQALERHNAANPERPVLLLNFGANDPALTNERCTFWHFRFAPNADQQMEALTSWLRGRDAVRRVFLINQDYAPGRALAASAREMLARKRSDVEIVGDERHPIGGVGDFAPYVARIRQSGADTVITGDWGADLVGLVRAARAARLPADILSFHADARGTATAISADGEDRLHLVSAWSPNERSFGGAELREDFRRRRNLDFTLKPAYDAMRALSESIRRTGSADALAVARAMSGLRFASLNGEVEMRAADHQLQQPLLVSSWQKAGAKGVRFDEERSGYGWQPEALMPAYVGVQPTSCNMRRP